MFSVVFNLFKAQHLFLLYHQQLEDILRAIAYKGIPGIGKL